MCESGHSFPVVGTIPHLVPPDTQPPDPAYVSWIADYYKIRFSPRQHVKAERLVREFLEITKPQTPVLDVGCGRADKAPLFPTGDYIGVDPIDPVEAGMIDLAPAPLVRGLGERLPFADAVFGSVILWGVLDHVADPARVYEEAARVLRPGGTVCVLNQITAERDKVWLHVAWWALRKVFTGDFAGILAIARHSVLSPASWKFTRVSTVDAIVGPMSPHFEVTASRAIDDGHVGIVRAEKRARA